MRFALKALPLGLLGWVVALLAGCGSGGGLLPAGEASGLQSALANVQSACANGQPDSAALAAQRFSDRVDALSPRSVDRQLIANLQQGAGALERLAARTCAPTTSTTPTTTTPTTTPTTPTTTTPTTPTTTTPPTTPTTPTTPTGGETTPPGGGTGPGDEGGGGGSGGAGGGGKGQGGGKGHGGDEGDGSGGASPGDGG